MMPKSSRSSHSSPFPTIIGDEELESGPNVGLLESGKCGGDSGIFAMMLMGQSGG